MAAKKKIAAGVAGIAVIGAAALLGRSSNTAALIPGKAAVPQPTITQLCTSGYTATIRPPASYTTALKVKQLHDFGFKDQNTADFEEDHLISLEIGGDPRSPSNLWPEPWSEARKKDQEENQLHTQICNHEITPKQAQKKIVADWPTHKS